MLTHYTVEHKNRLVMPNKHLLVVEDDLLQQARFAKYFLHVFGHQSNVRVNFAACVMDAHAIVFDYTLPYPDLIILDHDTQFGNGVELIESIRSSGLKIPIITASGIPNNNLAMMDAGANVHYRKDDIINGMAEEIIVGVLGKIQRTNGWEGIL